MSRPLWDEGPALGLPPLEGRHRADACVVGLGGTGLAVVRALCARGLRVIGLEAREVAAGAAGSNGGLLLAGLARFYHETVTTLGRDRARAWYAATLAELDRLEAESPATIRRTGSLRIAADEAELADCERHLAALAADGFPAEPYEGPEGQGILLPSDGVMQPLERCRALARAALSEGAMLAERSEVVAVAAGRVRTGQAEVECKTVIVAVDGALERLLPVLGDRVRTARLQMLGTAPEPGLRLPRPVYVRWGYEYYQQLPDCRLALGGFRDAGGGEEWTLVASPSAAVQQRLEEFLRTGLGSRAVVTHRWAALVGFTPNGIPVADEIEPGLWALGAYSGTGNVVGPLLGRAVAACVAGEPAPLLELVRGGAAAAYGPRQT